MAFTDSQASSPIDLQNAWRRLASAPPGGTVIGLAAAQTQPWLASPAGLFHYTSQGWSQQTEGLPFTEVNAVYAVSRSLFVAGLPAGVAYTTDGGRRWFASRIDQTQEPVTCFTASPRFGRDGVVLAGTQGDGILRSIDGGRYWNLSNFGLRNFEVFALVCAPNWSEHEQVYAATGDGVYESPNGGRAWRQLGAGLQQRVVLCMTLLPLAGHPSRAGGVLFVGTEQDGLFRSDDGGLTWQLLDLGGDPGPVNSLCVSPQGIVLAGSSDLGLLRSSDGGQTWLQVGPRDAIVLSLGASVDRMLAGCYETGLLISSDVGLNWQADPGLKARRFSLLAAAPGGGWLAGSPTAGLWQLPAGAATWQALSDWPSERPLYALATAGEQVLAASLDGVWRGRPDGSGWTQALQTEYGINLLAAVGMQVWAGHVTGSLWRSEDGGASWQSLQPAFQDQALVALEVSAQYEKDQTLLAASADTARQELNFWRSQDGGLTWSAWFKEHTRWYALQLAPAGEQAAESSFGFGLTVLTQSAHDPQRAEISRPEAPIVALLAVPDSPARIAAAGQTLLAALDGQDWQDFDTGLLVSTAVGALAISPQFAQDGQILALTQTGDLWTRSLPTR